MWQGARNLRLILRICCGVTVPHHQTRRFQLRHLLLRQQEIRQNTLLSHARTVENLCVVVRIFKLHVKFCKLQVEVPEDVRGPSEVVVPRLRRWIEEAWHHPGVAAMEDDK